MFTWKRLFLSLGFLFLILIIGWTTWYFTIVRPKLIGDPITLYNTKSQITADDEVDTAAIEKFHIEKNIQEDGTAETHKDLKSINQSVREGAETAAASPTQEEINQHAAETHSHSEEEWAKELKEMEEFSETVRKRLADVEARLKVLNENRKKRLYEKANELNSLSAEEQQAYFDNIRSGKVLEEIPPNFFESARANMLSKGNSEEAIDMVLEGLKQKMQEYASEAGAKRHLEELRAHGFEPKF